MRATAVSITKARVSTAWWPAGVSPVWCARLTVAFEKSPALAPGIPPVCPSRPGKPAIEDRASQRIGEWRGVIVVIVYTDWWIEKGDSWKRRDSYGKKRWLYGMGWGYCSWRVLEETMDKWYQTDPDLVQLMADSVHIFLPFLTWRFRCPAVVSEVTTTVLRSTRRFTASVRTWRSSI